MSQLQTRKDAIGETRLVETGTVDLAEGEICVDVETFGFSANNVTYAVAGDTLGYWQFFPPAGDGEGWGIIPIWGFARVAESRHADIEVGERFFGYFPTGNALVMAPTDVAPAHFFDGSGHRSQLPKGYNHYRRLKAEPVSDETADAMRMLLYPLYITSFVLWDQLKEHDWYGAERVLLLSASSKTAIGLAHAIATDSDVPPVVALTSSRNTDFVSRLGYYDIVETYDDIESLDAVPTAIVDMAGNGDVLGRLHAHLGDAMRVTLSVGLTHWEGERRDSRVIKDRTEFFFAPSRIQQRMKDWGPQGFADKSTVFFAEAARASAKWLKLETVQGLEGLAEVYPDVVDGSLAPDRGLIVKL